MTRRPAAGFTLLELIVDFALLVIIALAVTVGLRSSSSKAVKAKDKNFGVQKAIQIMDELRAVIPSLAADNSVGALDLYDDGGQFNPILTAQRDVTTAADPVSGNANGRYMRQVSISPVANDPLSRQVYVRIYLANNHDLLAETMGILSASKHNYVATQVFDVYVIAIENVNGTRASPAGLRTLVNGVIRTLQSRNPGLEFRTHLITRMSYGRDPFYTPYINKARDGAQQGFPNAYLYVGLLDHVSKSLLLSPDNIQGRINIDGTLVNAAVNPLSYSLADQYNHAVRYPEEVALYNAACVYAGANNKPEISLRMLLERLNSSPTEFNNILLLNLEGASFALPPLRNYSDAAKDPGSPNRLYWRVVTHPEQLQYDSGSPGGVKLRVYSYIGDRTQVDATPFSAEVDTVTVFLPDIPGPLGAGQVTVRYVEGSDTRPYVWNVSSTSHTVTSYNGGTLLTLYHSPLRHGRSTDGSGLDPANRLYGFEYIPSETAQDPPTSFQRGTGDLASTSNDPKNTARWIIEFNAGVIPDGEHEIQTRIGDDPTTGWPTTGPSAGMGTLRQPANISRTFVWVGRDPPYTEKFQFTGDPRLMPYIDVKRGRGFNWFFLGTPNADTQSGGFPAAAPYSGYKGYGTHLINGYDNQPYGLGTAQRNWVENDIPRFAQLYRRGLLTKGAVYAASVGAHIFVYGQMGGDEGQEAADDGAGNFVDPYSFPWRKDNDLAAREAINESACYGDQTEIRLIARGDWQWVALPWLGELYPDQSYSTSWDLNAGQSGNLPTLGAVDARYYRARYDEVKFLEPLGFDYNHGANGVGSICGTPTPGGARRTASGPASSASFINGNPSGSGNNVYCDDCGAPLGDAPITPDGRLLSAVFHVALPDKMQAFTAAALDYTPAQPPAEWNDPVYASERTTTRLVERYYDDPSGGPGRYSAGLVQWSSGTQVGYLYSAYTSGSDGGIKVVQMGVTGVLRGMLAGGTEIPVGTAGHIPQLPLVTVTGPADMAEFQSPITIPVAWSIAWNRWDGVAYGFSETTPLMINIKYSSNNGRSWYFANRVAGPARGSAGAGVLDPAENTGASPFAWNVTGLALGTYIIRVEAYRSAVDQHYAYHQRDIVIKP